MKAKDIKDKIKQEGNKSVDDTCAIRQGPAVSIWPARNPMSERDDEDHQPIPASKPYTRVLDRVPTNNPPSVPTAYRVTWRTDEHGKVHEIKTPIRCIGFNAYNNSLGAVEEI